MIKVFCDWCECKIGDKYSGIELCDDCCAFEATIQSLINEELTQFNIKMQAKRAYYIREYIAGKMKSDDTLMAARKAFHKMFDGPKLPEI